MTYSLLINYDRLSRKDGTPLVKRAIERAESIDPDLAVAWGIHGYIQKNLNWDWQAAQEYTRKALMLEPNNNGIIIWRASTFRTLGRIDDALVLYERAYLSNPLSIALHSGLGLMYNVLHRYDDAIKMFEKQLELRPNYHWAYYNLGRSYLNKGEAERALLEINKNPDNLFKAAGLVMAYTTLGRESDAQAALERLVTEHGSIDSVLIAQAYAWRGQKDEAFEWLEDAFAKRQSGIAYLLGDNMFYSLLDDPRWADFLKKVNLYEYWQVMPAKYGGPQS